MPVPSSCPVVARTLATGHKVTRSTPYAALCPQQSWQILYPPQASINTPSANAQSCTSTTSTTSAQQNIQGERRGGRWLRAQWPPPRSPFSPQGSPFSKRPPYSTDPSSGTPAKESSPGRQGIGVGSTHNNLTAKQAQFHQRAQKQVQSLQRQVQQKQSQQQPDQLSQQAVLPQSAPQREAYHEAKGTYDAPVATHAEQTVYEPYGIQAEQGWGIEWAGRAAGSQVGDTIQVSTTRPDPQLHADNDSTSNGTQPLSSSSSSKSRSDVWQGEATKNSHKKSSTTDTRWFKQQPRFTSWRQLLSWLESFAAVQHPSHAIAVLHSFKLQKQQQQQQAVVWAGGGGSASKGDAGSLHSQVPSRNGNHDGFKHSGSKGSNSTDNADKMNGVAVPGLLVQVLNQVAKLASAQASGTAPQGKGNTTLNWEQLLDSVIYILRELEPNLISTQQQQQQQYTPTPLSIGSDQHNGSHQAAFDSHPLAHESSTTSSHQGSTIEESKGSHISSYQGATAEGAECALTAAQLARLTRSLNVLLLLPPPSAPAQTHQAHLPEPKEQHQKKGQQQQMGHKPLPFALPSRLAAHLRGAVAATFQRAQPYELTLLLRALSLDGVCIALGVKGAKSDMKSGVWKHELSASSPPAVASAALAAIMRVLPQLSPLQCSVSLSCVTLLEWQPPVKPWVQAVMARLEEAELQAIAQTQAHEQQTKRSQQQQQQSGQRFRLHQHTAVEQQSSQHQPADRSHTARTQPQTQQPVDPTPSNTLVSSTMQPMTVRDAEQVLVSLAHLHVHPPPRLADMLLRSLAASFTPGHASQAASAALKAQGLAAQSSVRPPPGFSDKAPGEAPGKAPPSSPQDAASDLPSSPTAPAPTAPGASATLAAQTAVDSPSSTSVLPLTKGDDSSFSDQSGVPPLSPVQLTSSLWAIASLGLHPPAPWLSAFMQITFGVVQGFSARTLAEVLWSIASLRWEPSQHWMDSALSGMAPKVEQLRPGEVAITVWALSRLRFRANPDLLTSLYTHVTRPHILPHLDGRGVSMLMTACARTNYLPPATCMRPLADRILWLLENTARGPDKQQLKSNEESAGQPASNQDQHQAHTSHEQQQQQQQHASHQETQQQQQEQPRQPPGDQQQPCQHPSDQHHLQQQQLQQQQQPNDPPLSPQGVANLAWAIDARALYTDYPQLIPALHAASLRLMPRFVPVELGMLGLAVGSTVQAQVQARAKAQRRAQPAPLPPITLPSPDWVAAYAAASRRVLLQQQRAQQLSAAQHSRASRQSRSTGNSSDSKLGNAKGTVIRRGSNVTEVRGRVPSSGGGDAHVTCSMLLGFARMSPEGKLPPSDWLDLWFEVTGATLLTYQPRELELICEGLRVLHPPPAPPLPWVRAFSDRRDMLSSHTGINAHLRKQLLLVLRVMRNAWQARVSQSGVSAFPPPAHADGDSAR